MDLENILLTGGTGFIGKHLLQCLVVSKYSVSMLSRNRIKNYPNIFCDFSKDTIPEDALNSIDTVFHIAGFAHDLRGDISKDKYLYQKINTDATIQLAKLAAQNGVKRFIFVSSVKAGGEAVDGQCMTEKDQSEPEGVYGKTKREAELKLLEIGRNSGMFVSIVRPSLVYGPGAKGNLNLMMAGIDKGWFPPLPETGNRRSMIHVDDLVQALMLVATNEYANGEIFIATGSKPYSSREIYEAMCFVLGKPIPKWSIPKFLFKIAAVVSLNMKYKVNKLLGDEYYSSEKLKSIGFNAQRTLLEMNETSF
jgi:UDP-glucose 4-epimerase